MVGADGETPLPMPQVIARELLIVGSHGMPAHDYPQMLAMLRSGQLQPQELVSRTIALEDAPLALEEMGAFATAGVTVVDRF